MDDLLLIILILAGIWYWWDTQQCNEIALYVCKKKCEMAGLQLLDASVSRQRSWLRRGPNGYVQICRLYSFEYSNRELCEFDYLIEHCDNRAQNINNQDLTEVIKQKIVHPAIHLHLTKDDELHEIRLGVATKNPFVFLYQFAFQMIAEKDGENTRIQRYNNSPRKQQEINRLADLIGEEIENGRISPGKLLAG